VANFTLTKWAGLRKMDKGGQRQQASKQIRSRGMVLSSSGGKAGPGAEEKINDY